MIQLFFSVRYVYLIIQKKKNERIELINFRLDENKLM